MGKIRALILAEAANPEWVSVPLVGWSHASAIGRVCDAHLVTQVRNKEAIARAGVREGPGFGEFTAIDTEAIARRLHRVASRVRGGANKGWTTASVFTTLSYYEFERRVWREFEPRLRAGEYDLVHRITPLSPATPSPIARRCRAIGVPFVLGPINGGLAWPRGFEDLRRREREWLSPLRGLHRFLPGYASTRRWASVIVVGSRTALAEVPVRHAAKAVYLPENAIDPGKFPEAEPAGLGLAGPMRVAFVGRLVPLKGVDMLLESAGELVRAGEIVLDIIGEGPELERLRGIAQRERLGAGVEFPGWVAHDQLADRLRTARVLAFPSVREFGGGAVLEAMAMGLCPVVLDYGGPGELVTNDSGVAIPMGTRESIVAGLRAALEGLSRDRGRTRTLGRRARDRARSLFTWDAKARQMIEIYEWALGRRSGKPDFGVPLRSLSTRELAPA